MFLQNLKHLVVHCNFGTTLEVNIRDQFVSGLRCENMRSRLFAEPSLNYKRAVELALTLEAAERHAVEAAAETALLTTAGCARPELGQSEHAAGLHRVEPSSPVDRRWRGRTCWRSGLKMTLDIHVTEASPPCSTVLLTAAILDLKINKIVVDFANGVHLSPEYLKLNPQHTVPILVDNDFCVAESRVIIRYLASKYGENSNLYPEDLQARAKVDYILDFDLGSLFQKFEDYYYPQIYGGPPPTDAGLKKLQHKLEILNSILEGKTYAAGSELSIADISLLSSLATMDASDISFKDHPNVQKWFDFMRSNLPHYDIIENGLVAFKAYFAARINKSDS